MGIGAIGTAIINLGTALGLAQNITLDTFEAIKAGFTTIDAQYANGYVATSAAQTAYPVLATAYAPPGSATQCSLKSTSANDTAAGSGAQVVSINYLDASMARHTTTVTLNGTTAVALSVSDLAWVDSMTVTQVGTNLGVNAGTITLYPSANGTGTPIAAIQVDGTGVTQYAHKYVAEGETLSLIGVIAGSGAVQGAFYVLYENPLVTNAPWTAFGPPIAHLGGDSKVFEYPAALSLPGPARVVLYTRPSAATADSAYGALIYLTY